MYSLSHVFSLNWNTLSTFFNINPRFKACFNDLMVRMVNPHGNHVNV